MLSEKARIAVTPLTSPKSVAVRLLPRYSVSEGRNLCASGTFDVVILDLHLHDGDGVGLLIGEIREAKPHCSVLMLTVFPGEADRTGADGVLGKDAAFGEIVGTVRPLGNGSAENVGVRARARSRHVAAASLGPVSGMLR